VRQAAEQKSNFDIYLCKGNSKMRTSTLKAIQSFSVLICLLISFGVSANDFRAQNELKIVRVYNQMRKNAEAFNSSLEKLPADDRTARTYSFLVNKKGDGFWFASACRVAYDFQLTYHGNMRELGQEPMVWNDRFLERKKLIYLAILEHNLKLIGESQFTASHNLAQKEAAVYFFDLEKNGQEILSLPKVDAYLQQCNRLVAVYDLTKLPPLPGEEKTSPTNSSITDYAPKSAKNKAPNISDDPQILKNSPNTNFLIGLCKLPHRAENASQWECRPDFLESLGDGSYTVFLEDKILSVARVGYKLEPKYRVAVNDSLPVKYVVESPNVVTVLSSDNKGECNFKETYKREGDKIWVFVGKPSGDCSNYQIQATEKQIARGPYEMLYKRYKNEAPINSGNAQNLADGVEYRYFPKCSSCKNNVKEVYLSESDYQALCLKAGLSDWGAGILVSLSWRARDLYKNGTIEDLRIYWDPSRPYKCRVKIQMSGIINGSSHREVVDGAATTFMRGKEGKAMITFASSMD
jgi:hypothetical protein